MIVLQFAAYIDGSRRVLEGFTCSPSSGDSFSMFGATAPADAGRHTFEIASFFNSTTGVVESPRVAAAAADGVRRRVAIGGRRVERRHVRGVGWAASSRAHVLAADLVDPVDVAVDARGRAFVVERRGTLRIIDGDSTATDAAPVEPLFGARDQGSRALSIALAPDFARSGLLYTLSAQPPANGSRLFVTRFRELRGRLGEAAVVVSHEMAGSGLGTRDSEPDSGLGEPDGALRFGPDGAMYIAAGSTGRCLRADPAVSRRRTHPG